MLRSCYRCKGVTFVSLHCVSFPLFSPHVSHFFLILGFNSCKTPITIEIWDKLIDFGDKFLFFLKKIFEAQTEPINWGRGPKLNFLPTENGFSRNHLGTGLASLTMGGRKVYMKNCWISCKTVAGCLLLTSDIPFWEKGGFRCHFKHLRRSLSAIYIKTSEKSRLTVF